MIRKKKRLGSWVLAGLAVCLITVLITTRSRPVNIPADVRNELLNSSSDGADLRMYDVNYVFNRDGKDEWILQARLARYFKRKDLLYLDKVKADFFSKDRKTVLLTGDYGTYFAKSKDMVLTGNVSAVSSSGERFYGQSITYKESTQVLSTLDNVTIINGGLRVDGKGLIYDLPSGRMSVMNNVKVSSDKL